MTTQKRELLNIIPKLSSNTHPYLLLSTVILFCQFCQHEMLICFIIKFQMKTAQFGHCTIAIMYIGTIFNKFLPDIRWSNILLVLLFSALTSNTVIKVMSSRSVNLLHTSLRKYVYSNILKILQPKRENFQIKKFWCFSCFCSKHRLWVLVRTASARRF